MDAIVKSVSTSQLSEDVRAAPQPVHPRPSRADAEAAVKTLIACAGDNPAREGLRDTPSRVVSAYEELFRGYRECPLDVLDRTFSEIDEILKPRGVAVMMEAEHLCMAMRGVQKTGVSTVTTQFTGSFREASEQAR